MGVSERRGSPLASRYVEAKVNSFRYLFVLEKFIRGGRVGNPCFEDDVQAAITASIEERATARKAVLELIEGTGLTAPLWYKDLISIDRAVQGTARTLERLLSLDRVIDVSDNPAHAHDYLRTVRFLTSQVFRPYTQLVVEIAASGSHSVGQPAVQSAFSLASMRIAQPEATSVSRFQN
ncbi:hypothetical protein [Rhodoligotrophos ferricapiens]|uniref:hypothetical protein n=1 Tax=Rhodoligotrophos ferricapiens TaxID=3069264 RepID=UPI00315C5053